MSNRRLEAGGCRLEKPRAGRAERDVVGIHALHLRAGGVAILKALAFGVLATAGVEAADNVGAEFHWWGCSVSGGVAGEGVRVGGARFALIQWNSIPFRYSTNRKIA